MGIRMTGKDEDIDGVEREIETDFRKILLAFDQAVVSGTPVDTGHARANWFMDFGTFTPRQTASLSAPNLPSDTWTIEAGNVFFHNSVPYIVYLDEGSSKQAPQGILDPATAAIRALL